MRKLLIAVCLLAVPCLSRAQKREASWENLKALRAGEKIEVAEMNFKMHKGTVVAVSEETLNLREGAADQTIRKEHVLRVTQLEKSHRLRNALIFSAVGAGAGAGIGVAAGGGCHHSYIITCSAAKRAAFGGVNGMVVGFPVGVAVPSHDTIYRSNRH
jgi:hypothetical protein